MSTFGTLNTAYSGLSAARFAMDVIGQNIANLKTDGYTRQRIAQSGIAGARAAGPLDTHFRVGQGVSIDGVTRIDNALLDSRVRSAAEGAGFWSVRAGALARVESQLNEPGDKGISASLDDFWSAWDDLSNNPGAASESAVLLEAAGALVGKISAGYRGASDEWNRVSNEARASVADINRSAAQVARLNTEIRELQASGNSASELLDARTLLTTDLAAMTGATVRTRGDGMVDVVLDGNSLVSGTSARQLAAVGATSMDGAATAPLHVEWADRPGVGVSLTGGELAASISLLGPAAPGGGGGEIAEAAASYDALAVTIASRVNAVHSTGATASGTTGLDFFSLPTTGSAALGLTVVPLSKDAIASASVGAGAGNGSIADAIAAIRAQSDGPDAQWSAFVVRVGVLTSVAKQEAAIASSTSAAAVASQRSEAGVDLDEETSNLLSYQHAYQGAARVMTVIDEALDTLINRTGIVGR